MVAGQVASKPRRIRSILLTITAVSYSIFVIGFCWMAYAEATAPHAAKGIQGQLVPSGAPQNTSPASDGAQHSLEAQAAKLDLDEKKLETQQQYLENRSKDIDKRADDLERLIAELTIGSSAYTLLLGLFAFFGLKGAASEADRYLATLKTEIETFKTKAAEDLGAARDITKAERKARNKEFADFRRAIEDDIPNFYGMQRALNTLLDRIRRAVTTSKIWTRGDSYNEMPEEKRQKVILAEMTVAAFDYFRLDSSDVQRGVVAQIFSELGSFYSGRARRDASRYDPSDMHRARLYIDRAHEMSPTNSRILAQRAGFVLTNTPKEGDHPTAGQLDEAELDLRESLRLDPSNISGLYNLAWIADERSQFVEAVDYLTRAISQRDVLPATERGPRMIAAWVNRACAQAKIRATVTDPAEQQTMDAKILGDCKEACSEGKLYQAESYVKKSLEREFGASGELKYMAAALMQTLSTVP
jgi:tetratricopeptide (TPR) repeat protein